MSRRLVSGEEQQHAGCHELVVRQPIALVVEVHEFREQIALRRGAARCDQCAEEIRHLVRRRLGALVLRRRLARAADEQRHLVGQALEALELAARHAQHVHDDQCGQRAGEIGNEVEALQIPDALEQPGGKRLDVGA